MMLNFSAKIGFKGVLSNNYKEGKTLLFQYPHLHQCQILVKLLGKGYKRKSTHITTAKLL